MLNKVWAPHERFKTRLFLRIAASNISKISSKNNPVVTYKPSTVELVTDVIEIVSL